MGKQPELFSCLPQKVIKEDQIKPQLFFEPNLVFGLFLKLGPNRANLFVWNVLLDFKLNFSEQKKFSFSHKIFNSQKKEYHVFIIFGQVNENTVLLCNVIVLFKKSESYLYDRRGEGGRKNQGRKWCKKKRDFFFLLILYLTEIKQVFFFFPHK